MRSLALLSFLLTGALAAQARTEFGIVAINPVGLNGTCTNFTSRGTLGSNPGSVLVEVPGRHFSGVGHDAAGTGTLFHNFHYLTQDQNASTVEPYSMEIRGVASPPPGPDPTATLMQLTGLSTPGGAGTVAWLITNTLATPSTAVPLCDTFFMGANVAGVSGSTPWPADGQSFHMGSYYILQGATASNPAPNAPNIAWNITAGASNQPNERTYRFYLGLDAAVLNTANEDPTLTGSGHCLSTAPAPYTNIDTGPGGLWPQCQGSTGSRNDGLQVRVLDAAAPGGFFVVFLGPSIGCPGVAVPAFFTGALYLNPGSLTALASGALDTAGVGVAPMVPPGTNCRPALNRILDFQAFVVNASFTLPGRVSNRAGVMYLP